jgi:uncharacterized protein YydD (DUF2326 family)
MIILAVRSDQPSFKRVDLTSGFNVILAERTTESTGKDSRNGLGKSSLIHVIRFCLGSAPNKTLEGDELSDWTFTIDIELAGRKYSISRNTKTKNKIAIDGNCSDWPIKPEIDLEYDGQQMINASDLPKVLGKLALDIGHPPKF